MTSTDFQAGYVYVALPFPNYVEEMARRAEDAGFDFCLWGDTQAFAGDPYVASTIAAQATSTIRVGPGVANPLTRVAAVTASAIATIQLESHGRALLGLGRGDSAVAFIGERPATTRTLDTYARTVQAYLRGECPPGAAGPIEWIGRVPKVPLDMACTGDKTISVAAAIADRVTLAVGAAPERIGRGLELARAAAAASGRAPSDVSYGAYLNVVVHDSMERARELAKTGVGLVAHFSAMALANGNALPPELQDLGTQLAQTYDMRGHGRDDAPQSRSIEDSFVDWFAVAGSPSYCIERIATLRDLGLDYIYLVSGSTERLPTDLLRSQQRFGEEVLPALRGILRR